MTKSTESSDWKLPAVSGVLLALSYLPGPFLAFNFVAFLPLLRWLDSNRDATPVAAVKAGLIFGLVAHLIALHWMYSMLAISWLAVLLYLGLASALAMRIAISVALMRRLRRTTRLHWALLLPICWLPLEWAQTWGDLRLTGDHFANSVARYPFLVQFADVVGSYGVGAFLLAVNGLLFAVARHGSGRQGRRSLAALAILLGLVLGYDAWSWFRPRPDRGTVRVAVIQPNIPLSVKHDRMTHVEQWGILDRLTRQAVDRGAQLVIWPESARPDVVYHWLDRPSTYAMRDVQQLARELEVAILTGAEYARIRTREDYDLYNAALAVDERGRMVDGWGAKIYLVPFTEGIPFQSVLGPLVEGKGGDWRWVSGGFAPGPSGALFDVAGSRAGVVVCYEELFPDLTRNLRKRGAEFQVVVTNDAWFGRSFFQMYQVNVLRLRAIESRTEFARSANTGISGFVDTRGRLHGRTKLFAEAIALRDVNRTTRPTVYDRIGDVAAWMAVAGLLVALAVGRAQSGSTAV